MKTVSTSLQPSSTTAPPSSSSSSSLSSTDMTTFNDGTKSMSNNNINNNYNSTLSRRRYRRPGAEPLTAVSGTDAADRRRMQLQHQPSPPLSLEEAKMRFSQTVAQSMDVLMTEHGFSRERATAALLRILSATTTTTAATESPAVSDEQVFNAMQHYGLTAAQAMRALTVSTTLERMCNATVATMSMSSFVTAVQELTDKLAHAKVEPGRFLDDDHSSLSDLSHCSTSATKDLARVLPPPKAKAAPVAAAADGDKRTMGVPQRLVLVKQQSQQQSASSSAKKARLSSASSSSVSKPQPSKAGAKDLLLQEVSSSPDTTASLSPRQRSDSVAEQVSAKLAVAAESKSANTANNDTTPRLKRARDNSDDAAAGGGSSSNTGGKRSRTSTA